jgi:hypothetical protein
MSRKLEIELEMRICEKAVEGLLAAGYAVSVNDGEETTVKNCTDKSIIMDAVFTTDEDYLLAYKEGEEDGWVRLIWGNVQDLISDYTTNLEDAFKDANDFAASYD